MAATSLIKENFDSIIEGTDVVLVDFWTSWCGPCRRFRPIFEEASGRHGEVAFSKVDTEAEQDLVLVLDAQSIPTIAAFRADILMFGHSGLLNRAQIDDLVKQVRKSDPEKLKEKVREGSAS